MAQTQKSAYAQIDQYLSEEGGKIRKLSRGDIIEGVVADVRDGYVVVDVGYKSEGIVAGKELKSDTLDWRSLKVGDNILVYVVKPEDDEGQLVLSIRRTQQASCRSKQWWTDRRDRKRYQRIHPNISVGCI